MSALDMKRVTRSFRLPVISPRGSGVVVIEDSSWGDGTFRGRPCYSARWRDAGGYARGDTPHEAVDALLGHAVSSLHSLPKSEAA